MLQSQLDIAPLTSISFPPDSRLTSLENFASEQQQMQAAGGRLRALPAQQAQEAATHNGELAARPGAFPPMKRPSLVTSLPKVSLVNCMV